MFTLDLDYQNPENYTDLPQKAEVESWVKMACSLQQPYSLSIRVVGIEEARSLNKSYRDKDYATNVLSFMFEPPPIPMEISHLGDLVLCKSVVEKESQSHNKRSNDHWAHLIIHGVLHLQGYDHLSSKQADEMEGLEISCLKTLGINNPYHSIEEINN